MDTRRVIVTANVGEFFHQEVVQARHRLGIQLTDTAEYYLVNLLCEYSKVNQRPMPGEEALALMYQDALEAASGQRVQKLRALGDLALYISGFFVESIEKSLVDVDYYIHMGGQAYGNASSLVGNQHNGDTFAELYQQLARKFTELVDLLNEIADKTREGGDSQSDLLRLYDRWVRTGSDRIHRLLVQRGLAPLDKLSGDYIQ